MADPPPYTESLAQDEASSTSYTSDTSTKTPVPLSTNLLPGHRAAPGQIILDSISVSRAQHLKAIADDLILPLIQRRASNGLSRTSIALLPSDVGRFPSSSSNPFGFSSQNNNNDQNDDDNEDEDKNYDEASQVPIEVIGLTSLDGPPTFQIQLRNPSRHRQGPSDERNTSAFWNQPGVVHDLERILRARLALNFATDVHITRTEGAAGALMRSYEGDRNESRRQQVQAPSPPPPPPPPQPTQPSSSTSSKPRNFFFSSSSSFRRKVSSSSSSSATAVANVNPNSVPGSVLQPTHLTERIAVRASLEEVCIRTTSAFGLYETCTRHAVVVQVDILC